MRNDWWKKENWIGREEMEKNEHENGWKIHEYFQHMHYLVKATYYIVRIISHSLFTHSLSFSCFFTLRERERERLTFIYLFITFIDIFCNSLFFLEKKGMKIKRKRNIEGGDEKLYNTLALIIAYEFGLNITFSLYFSSSIQSLFLSLFSFSWTEWSWKIEWKRSWLDGKGLEERRIGL